VVIDLAIADDDNSALLIEHRLPAAIEAADRKARRAKRRSLIRLQALPIGPSVRECLNHHLHQGLVPRTPIRRPESHGSADPTHP